jgi:hypothetical protein
MDCVHFNKPDQGCKIRVGGCGWNNEYCAPAIFGDTCEYVEPVEHVTMVIKASNHDHMGEMDAFIKRSKTIEHKALMRKGRREFKR